MTLAKVARPGRIRLPVVRCHGAHQRMQPKAAAVDHASRLLSTSEASSGSATSATACADARAKLPRNTASDFDAHRARAAPAGSTNDRAPHAGWHVRAVPARLHMADRAPARPATRAVRARSPAAAAGAPRRPPTRWRVASRRIAPRSRSRKEGAATDRIPAKLPWRAQRTDARHRMLARLRCRGSRRRAASRPCSVSTLLVGYLQSHARGNQQLQRARRSLKASEPVAQIA